MGAAVRATALALALLVGCCPIPPAPRAAVPWDAQTEPLAVVLAKVNHNNEKIPTIWGRFGFAANVVQNGKQRRLDGDGIVLYTEPSFMRMRLRHPVGGDVLEMGVNDERYWIVDRQQDQMWWGHLDTIGAPCSEPVPIRPDLLAEVLGIGTISTNFTAPPVPVMRFDNEVGAYVILWALPIADPSPARWVAQREVWYDWTTLLPVQVRLYDANGRTLVRATLSNHREVDGSGGAKVAGRYDLFLPDSGSTMTIDLNNAKLRNNGVPNEGSFAMPDPNGSGVKRIIQVDANCGSHE